MNMATFDARAAVKALAGVATKADIAPLKADLYRALWIQGAGLVAVMAALGLFG